MIHTQDAENVTNRISHLWLWRIHSQMLSHGEWSKQINNGHTCPCSSNSIFHAAGGNWVSRTACCACKIRGRKHVDALIETLHVLWMFDDEIFLILQRYYGFMRTLKTRFDDSWVEVHTFKIAHCCFEQKAAEKTKISNKLSVSVILHYEL